MFSNADEWDFLLTTEQEEVTLPNFHDVGSPEIHTRDGS